VKTCGKEKKTIDLQRSFIEMSFTDPSAPPAHSRVIQGVINIGHDLSDYVFSETKEQQELKQIVQTGDVEPPEYQDETIGADTDETMVEENSSNNRSWSRSFYSFIYGQ